MGHEVEAGVVCFFLVTMTDNGSTQLLSISA